jgi:alpha-1,2-mannosyltransferase
VCFTVVLVGSIVAGMTKLVHGISESQYGFDFHGSWRAAGDILSGRNPYPAPDANRLLLAGNAFVVPPLLGLLITPVARLPFGVAVAIWNVICGTAFVAALAVVGIRDRRLYLIAGFSFPVISSIILGQYEGLFALAVALCWRYRDSWPSALMVALLIAAKFFAWPLILWFLLRGRIRLAMAATLGSVALLILSWSLIDFHGFAGYPRLFAANSHAASRTDSPAALVLRIGGSHSEALIFTLIFVAAVVAGMTRAARSDPLTTFAASIFGGLMLSPIVWSHYLVLLFVPLALRRPRLDWAWLLVAVFWLSPGEPPRTVLQLSIVLATAAAVALGSASRPTTVPT